MGASVNWDQTPLFAGALVLPMEFQAGEIDLFRGGKVQVGWDEHGLRVHAKLEDDNVFTRATANNERLWQMGDVFELFLKLAQHEDYFELHTAPSGHSLQLHFSTGEGIVDIRDGRRTLESFMVEEPIFEFLSRKTGGGWEVLALVPTRTLDPGLENLEGGELQISFGRYDYADAKAEPILSSTSRHEVLNFHRIHEWTTVELG